MNLEIGVKINSEIVINLYKKKIKEQLINKIVKLIPKVKLHTIIAINKYLDKNYEYILDKNYEYIDLLIQDYVKKGMDYIQSYP